MDTVIHNIAFPPYGKRNKVLTTVMTYRTSVSKERWGKLEGNFSLPTMPDRVVFYLEGPSPGIDLLIKSALITCSKPSEYEVIIHFNPFLLICLPCKKLEHGILLI
jgi:hypothetical protein